LSGWTKTARPSSSYANKLKKHGIKDYRHKEKRLAEYEENHLIAANWIKAYKKFVDKHGCPEIGED
jgi:hypothetical protein